MGKFNKLTRVASKVGKVLKKHSPEILMVTGVVGVVTSAVMACKATTKLNDIVEEGKTDAEEIHKVAESRPEEFTEDDVKRAITINTGRTALKVAKLYAPSVALGVLSLTALVTSNIILRKRIATATAAYIALDESFKTYRGRVKERFGDEVEKEIRLGTKTEEIVNEDGTVEKVTTIAGTPASEYAVVFDTHTSCIAGKNKDYNLTSIRGIESFLNQQLESKGFVTLNEVYDALGMEGTRIGLVAGWVYDKNEYTKIEIEVTDILNDAGEPALMLDFNADKKYVYESM